MQKRDLEIQSPDERDGTQRSLGFVGLSAIAHSALLIAVLLAPSFKTQMGEIASNEAGATLEMKSETSAAADSATSSMQTSEVLLADASDETAVALPTEVKPIKAAQPKAASPALIEGDVAINDALADARKKTEAEAPLETLASNEPAKTAQLDDDDADDEKVDEPTNDAPPAEAGPSAIVNAKPDETAPVETSAAVLVQPAALTAPPAAVPASPTSTTASESKSSGTTSSTTSALSTAAPSTTIPSSTAPSSSVSGVISGTPANSAGNSPGRLSVPIGSPIRDARTLIAMPGNAKPVYPLPDKLAGRQGTAVLVGSIRADGSVAQVAIEKSSGSRMMDESAAKTFKSWRYKAGQEGFVRLPVQFQLVGDAKTEPARLKRQ